MFNGSKIIGLALLIGLLLPIESKTEETELFQKFYSPKLALGTNISTSNMVLLNCEEKESLITHSKPNWATYAVEFLGATLGSGTGAVVGFFLKWGHVWRCERNLDVIRCTPLSIIAVVGAPMGSAYGATITGKWLKQKGSFWNALAGSAVGIVTFVTNWVFWDNHYLYCASFLSIPLGALLGYNLGK